MDGSGRERSDAVEEVVTEPVLGWIPAAVGAALVSALATWVLAAGVAVLGWLPGVNGSVGETLGFGSRMWLLGHFGGIQVGTASWTLAPLGLTLIIFICLRRTASFAAHQAHLAHQVRHGAVGMDLRTQVCTIGRVAGLQTAVYVLVVLIAAVSSPGTHVGRALLGALLLSAVATVPGAMVGVRARPLDVLPAWARAVPRAVVAAQLVMLVGAAAVLVTALIQQHERVTALSVSAGAPVTGTIALTVLQLAYLPNLLLWSGSWTLAAGFTLGDGSIVAPVQTQLGLLPAIPVLGALPDEGPGHRGLLVWLTVGVLAGAVAAVTVMRARRRARFDETSLVGGLAGLLSGLVFVLFALLSGGDLGSNRLTGLGPRLTELVVMAPTVMGLAGLFVGLVWGLVRRPLRTSVDDEETVVLGTDPEPTVRPKSEPLDEEPGDESSDAAPQRRRWPWRRRAGSKDGPGPDDEPTVVLE